TPRRSPGGSGRPACGRRRSGLFLYHLLEHLLVQGELGDQAFEAFVLDLQLLEAFGVVGLHAAVLLAPAVEGGLADGQLLADLSDRQARGQAGLGGAELEDDLLRRVLLHQSSPRPQGPSETLIPPGPVFGEHTSRTMANRSPLCPHPPYQRRSCSRSIRG